MAKKKIKTIVLARQGEVVKNLRAQIKRGEKLNLYKAGVEAGYSEDYMKTGQIQKTDAWQQIMEEVFDDRKISAIHADLLEAQEIKQINFHYKVKDDELSEVLKTMGIKLIGTKRFMSSAVAFIAVPDTFARDKALDKVYKLKKRYDNTIHLKGALGQLSDAELEAEIASQVSDALGLIAGAASPEDQPEG